ncbi:MAG: DNA polymerase III subunit beta [Alphaproteobacteria bacterium 16-39-46]|nr:MAG: DNA polymerase III subunit beta [Alphaproteobacteria bacterium 16-39-46]OZA43288.1 MAG: DNA polymerase III subunit beta [Alphaproteobacteria bacterium 17-39-52]HQS84066.1 DNA polymerase III subunit beta [Alphaproteobacteria bacterium]HQS93928.1 DNA polymerase III subunit beta [Alphaproteobacteria bacterium]
MKATIGRSELLKALQHAKGIIEKRTTVPILSNILIEAGQGNELTLSSTDLELSIHESLVAEKVEELGAITVSAQMLYDIISRLPEDSSPELSCHQDTVDGREPFNVKVNRSTFRLGTLPAEEYAEIKRVVSPYEFTMKASDLGDLIEKTRYAMSLEESRYYLNGLYFEVLFNDDKPFLRAVATDGHRLAKAEALDIQFGKNVEGQSLPKIIVPQKTISEVVKLLDKGGEVIVSFSSRSISFTFGGVHLQSRLIDGAFPDYEKVIPNDNPFFLKVPTKLFADAVDRVSVMASDKTHTIKLTIQEETLMLSSSNPELGTAFEEVEVSYAGVPFETGFNARYLLDAARHVKGDMLSIALKDPGSAILLQDEKDPGLSFVVMPMRV